MTPVPLAPLETGQRIVMHVAALVPSLALAAGGLAAGYAARTEFAWPGWPIALTLGLVALWSLVVAPRRRWAAWGWALDENELHVAHGVWTRVHTVVPLGRVQHIDVAQGPLERALGVARLVLHTAGTAHATVTLPGVSRATAESLRDTIRAHIKAEQW
ncbi:PH domain-containing protein [Sphingomonas alpina]|uniref:PH domain-containing protein n=1 Tax=Sphingomonas alpina TaxID=653931 RepID=A0A7H0LFB7_9SPHN|nr:PH domain-containing protein [Sphingomonas alpina]QNQ08370.1 PH domain-containing protein [Sphingomonas alpina]